MVVALGKKMTDDWQRHLKTLLADTVQIITTEQFFTVWRCKHRRKTVQTDITKMLFEHISISLFLSVLSFLSLSFHNEDFS